MRSRPALVAIALVTAAAGFLLVTSPHPTTAAWQDAKAFGVSTSAVSAAAVPTVSCGAASGLLATAIPISWTAPAGTTPSRYRLVWSGSAGSGQAYFTTSPGSVGGGLLSVVGTSTVTVYPEYCDWVTSPASSQTRTVTTIAALGVVVSWTCA